MEFKVGDWVRVLRKDGAISSGLIGKVTGTPETTMYDNSIWIHLENGFSSSTKPSNLEIWQPKEGEWCWFWNYTDTPNFMMFNGITEDNLYNGITCIGGCDIEFDYCEPFIGELPSFIKDK